MDLLDLPGSYSLQVRSPDEAVARDVLLGRVAGRPRPDVIICVVDATNLERNLYLVAQLLELEIPLVVGLNMVDVAEEAGRHRSRWPCAKRLGVPVIPMVATKGSRLDGTEAGVSQSPLPPPAIRAPMPEVIEREVQALAEQLPVAADVADPKRCCCSLCTIARSRISRQHQRAIVDATLAAQERIQPPGSTRCPRRSMRATLGSTPVCAGHVRSAESDDASLVADKLDGCSRIRSGVGGVPRRDGVDVLLHLRGRGYPDGLDR